MITLQIFQYMIILIPLCTTSAVTIIHAWRGSAS